jgi:uncharacterized protein (TIGR02246 family)
MALGVWLMTVAACTGAEAPQVPATTDPQAAAGDALRVFVESWNRAASGDTLAPPLYGTLYWPDAELVDPSGLIWEGQAAIVQMHVDLWKGPFQQSRIAGTVRRVRSLSPDLMIADFDLELALAGPAPASLPGTDGKVRAHLKHVMQRRDGAWKVIAAQNTFYSAPPAGP